MGYKLSLSEIEKVFKKIVEKYDVYAPKRFKNQGRYSDTDIVRYEKISEFCEIVFDKKSDYPAKEVLSPISQTLFYFTEDSFKEASSPSKPVLIFARPCDINAIKIQAKIYEENGGYCDSFFARARRNTQFVLMECNGGDDTCFCVSMGTNISKDWVMAFKTTDDSCFVEVALDDFNSYFSGCELYNYEPVYVQENELCVEVLEIPNEDVLLKLKEHDFWKEFDKRCISCGSCTIACSTCSCFTTRDIVYSDNPKIGERRRIAASCQIEGFDKMSGQKEFRSTPGDRMRYKMLHKFYDYKKRFKDFHMCVGCGRCTNRCPVFISITSTLNKMTKAIKDITGQS